MTRLLHAKLDELIRLCAKRRVGRLEVFGSAARDDFDPGSSDLDFLVEFQALAPAEHADCFFGLLEDLERLFGLPVDLVERGPIRNPYFLEAIERTRVLLYEAAA